MFFRKRTTRICFKRLVLAVCAGLLLYGTFLSVVYTYNGDGEEADASMPKEIHRIKEYALHIKAKKDVKRTDDCDQWFADDIDENVRIISQYPRGQVDSYLAKLGDNQTGPKQMMTSFPVITTAANSAYYGIVQGLFKSIHEDIMPKYPDIKIIFYDIGLKTDQHKTMKQYCRCEVRKFPFDEMPSHVLHMKSYTWKPIIIKKLLMEFGWVWWMDSTIRFKTDQLDAPLAYSQENSVLFFTYDPVFSVALHTDVQTMEYLQEDRCKFRYFGEVESGFVLYHYDHVTRTIVDFLVACALNANCMCPPGTKSKLHCNKISKHDGRCHRFDQSVLSIALRRIFHYKNHYPLVDKPFGLHTVRRGKSVKYFPES